MSARYLLDVNLLLALAWESHQYHATSRRWFKRAGSGSFATCPITQIGFLRLSCNPAFTADALTPRAAMEVLESIVRLPGHEFWPDNLTANEALMHASSLTGHQQLTDAYLVGLAQNRGGRFATMDKRVAASAGPTVSALVELVA